MEISGAVWTIDRSNIDTDQIISARHLTGLTGEGLGQYLFEGIEENKVGAKILITGENFGCGSSREHAVWALLDRGIRAVLAPSFARIFEENAYNNGLCPVTLSSEAFHACSGVDNLRLDVDSGIIDLPDGSQFSFALNPLRKGFIVAGGFLEYLSEQKGLVRAWAARRASDSLAISAVNTNLATNAKQQIGQLRCVDLF